MNIQNYTPGIQAHFGGLKLRAPKDAISDNLLADAQNQFKKGRSFWTSGEWWNEGGAERKTNKGLELFTQGMQQVFQQVIEMLHDIINTYLRPGLELLKIVSQQNTQILQAFRANQVKNVA